MSLYAEWTTWDASILTGDINCAYGNRIDNLPGGLEITQLKFYLKRTGAPPGTVVARIGSSDMPNGTYLKQFGSAITCTDIATDWTWYEFNDSYIIPSSGDYRIYTFWNGNHHLWDNYVAIAQYDPHTLGDDYRKTTCLTAGGAFTDHELNHYIVLFSISAKTPVSYPSWDLSRVTGIRHIYRPGSYRLEATLGEVSTSIELPQRDIQIPTVVPAESTKIPKPPKTTPLRVPEKTALEMILALREEGLLPEAGASADITALEPLPIQAGILEQFKPISREELEKLGTVIGQEAPPEPSLWQKLTPWKEEKGETFGTAFTSTFRRGFGEVAKLGEMYKRFFGGRFG